MEAQEFLGLSERMLDNIVLVGIHQMAVSLGRRTTPGE